MTVSETSPPDPQEQDQRNPPTQIHSLTTFIFREGFKKWSRKLRQRLWEIISDLLEVIGLTTAPLEGWAQPGVQPHSAAPVQHYHMLGHGRLSAKYRHSSELSYALAAYPCGVPRSPTLPPGVHPYRSSSPGSSGCSTTPCSPSCCVQSPGKATDFELGSSSWAGCDITQSRTDTEHQSGLCVERYPAKHWLCVCFHQGVCNHR